MRSAKQSVLLEAGWIGLFPRLALAMVLQGKYSELIVIIAVVCSTWSIVNLNTSQRDLLTPYGNAEVRAVAEGNRMVSRRCVGGWCVCVCVRGFLLRSWATQV